MDRDYIITFDESGQPYISHISWRGVKTMASGRVSKGASRGMQGVGRGVRTAHKYIEKWGEGAKARYFYTQEELKAALQQGRQKVSQAASSVRQAAGNAAARGRAALSTASDKVRTTASSVGTKARDLSSRTSSVLQRHGSETLSAIKSGASAVRDRAKEFSGKDAHQRYEEAWERTSAAKDRLASNPNSAYAQREVDRAEEAEAKAHEDYLKTPLGRLNDTKSRVQEAAQYAADRAKDTAARAADRAKELADKVSSTAAAEKVKIGAEKAAEKAKVLAESAAEKAKIGAESAVEKAKLGAEKAAERVRGTAQSAVDKAKDVAGADEYKRYEEAWERTSAAKDRLAANPNSAYAQREVDRAEEAEAKAHEDYLKTPLGRLNDAKSRVQEVAQYAAERAKELADKASSSADKAKFSEYSRFDRDFDEKHYSEENAVGDTDFYAYKRGDGKTVILEEDMKWVLPKGVDPDSPEIKSALEKVSRDIAENGWRGDEWVDNVTEAINEAAEKARNK